MALDVPSPVLPEEQVRDIIADGAKHALEFGPRGGIAPLIRNMAASKGSRAASFASRFVQIKGEKAGYSVTDHISTVAALNSIWTLIYDDLGEEERKMAGVTGVGHLGLDCCVVQAVIHEDYVVVTVHAQEGPAKGTSVCDLALERIGRVLKDAVAA